MSNNVKTCHPPKGTKCLCGNAECSGLSLAFSIMGDARQCFVELPPYLERGSSPTRNKQRECYLRHLLPSHKLQDPTTSQYIALFHFHPGILWDFQGKDTIPLYLSSGKAVELRLPINEKDSTQDENGMPAFFYCPNYSLANVKHDLANLNAETKIQVGRQERHGNVNNDDDDASVDTHNSHKHKNVVFENIPQHVEMSDSSSSISSIEILVDPDRDAITLATLVSAAITCQSIIRKSQAITLVKQRKEQQYALVKLQSTVRMWIAMHNFSHHRHAAMIIQQEWRYYNSIKTRQVQAEWNAIAIQRMIRGFQARCLVFTKIPHQACIEIQKTWRRYWVLRDYTLYISDVVLMQSLARQRAALNQVEKRKAALVVLHRFARQVLAQQYYQKQQRASITIQSKWRQHVVSQEYSKKPSSVMLIQTATRRFLARRRAQARLASIIAIQQAWKCHWPQIYLNRICKRAVVKIQALARGYSCRQSSYVGWMMQFIKSKVVESQRRTIYEKLLQDEITSWHASVKVLHGGLQEINRAKRLVVGASMADEALVSALRAISQDDKCSSDQSVVVESQTNLPMDPVFKTLLNANAKMADRFDDMSGCGIAEIGPELDALGNELELQVHEATRVGNAIVKSMPTSDMKRTALSTQHAWDELEATVMLLWKGGELTSNRAARAEPNKVGTAQDKGSVTQEGPSSGNESTKSDTVTTPMRGQRESSFRRQGSPSTSMMTTPIRKTSSASSLDSRTSPQSVITASQENFSTPKSSLMRRVELTRQSSSSSSLGHCWRDGLPMSPSSRRSVFSRQVSSGDFSLSRNMNADDAMAIMAGEGSKKHGIKFFEYLSEALMTKNPPPLSSDLPSLSGSSSFRSSLGVRDRWLLESNYRAAAAHQALVWNAYLGLLSKMTDAVKEIELHRCTQLNSKLLVAVPLERRVLLEMREVHEQVMQEFLGIRHDPETLSDSVETMIEHHAQLLRQRDSDHVSPELNQFQNLVPDLSEPIESLETETTYGITHHAMVVERSVGLRSWKMTLVVATADRCMHLFDMSFIPEVTVGSSPNEAFDMLLPSDDFSGDEPIVPRQEKLLKNLHPVTTVNLRKCRILTVDQATVEVTEKCAGVFRDVAKRKFYLRGDAGDLRRWKHFLTRKVT